MQHHKSCPAQARVVKERFQSQRVGTGKVEVAAAPRQCVQVYGHAQPSAFRRNGAKQKVLQPRVVLFRCISSGGILRINGCGFVPRDVRKAEWPQVGDFKLFCNRTGRALLLQNGQHDLLQVCLQRRRYALQVDLLKVARAQFVLQRKKSAPVGVARRQGRVVQRKQQGVDV